MSLAVVTLKKGEGRLLKSGGMWIFDNEIATIMGSFVNGDIDVQYKGKKYICYISEPNPGYGKYFYVKDVDTN